MSLGNTGDLREPLELVSEASGKLAGVHAHLSKNRLDDPLRLLDQCQQQVLHVNRLMLALLGRPTARAPTAARPNPFPAWSREFHVPGGARYWGEDRTLSMASLKLA